MGSPLTLKTFQKKKHVDLINVKNKNESLNMMKQKNDKKYNNRLKPVTCSKRSSKKLQVCVFHMFFLLEFDSFFGKTRLPVKIFFLVTWLDAFGKVPGKGISSGYLVRSSGQTPSKIPLARPPNYWRATCAT